MSGEKLKQFADIVYRLWVQKRSKYKNFTQLSSRFSTDLFHSGRAKWHFAGRGSAATETKRILLSCALFVNSESWSAHALTHCMMPVVNQTTNHLHATRVHRSSLDVHNYVSQQKLAHLKLRNTVEFPQFSSLNTWTFVVVRYHLRYGGSVMTLVCHDVCLSVCEQNHTKSLNDFTQPRSIMD